MNFNKQAITITMIMLLSRAIAAYSQSDASIVSDVSTKKNTIHEITNLNRSIGGKLMITFQPFLLNYGCAKVDIEYRPILQSTTLSNWSYVVSPEIYLGEVTRDFTPEHLRTGAYTEKTVSVSGWGVSGMVKYYLDSNFQKRNDYEILTFYPYFFGCTGIQSVDLTYSTMAWIRDNNTSLPTYSLGNTQVINSTQQFYVFTGIGLMATITPIFVLDAYLSYGPRFGSQKPSALENKVYEDDYFTGRGWRFNGGLRLGIML
jgi:hypothetical protein